MNTKKEYYSLKGITRIFPELWGHVDFNKLSNKHTLEELQELNKNIDMMEILNEDGCEENLTKKVKNTYKTIK
jgi:hypothetical protein